MKTRLISALVATIIAVPLIYMGSYYFCFGVGLLAILGYKELLDLRKSHQELPKLMIVLGVVSLILLTLPTVFYQEKYTTKDAFYLLGITIFLGITSNLFIIARNRGLELFIYLLSIPILTDTFAYIFGSAFGKNKLCPRISPNKTWEGSFAGFFAGTFGGTIIYSLLVSSFSWKVIVLSAVLSTIGQVGDLFMSKIKRENEIKDFSNIMPGHGGILDRIDSFIFVILTYFLLMLYL